LREWLSAPADELRTRYDRLYFPRNDARYLRRNALVAAGNSRDPSLLDAVAPFADGEDPLLRDHAQWAADRLSGRG
jgi:epoxyqueuosine reductase QueG